MYPYLEHSTRKRVNKKEQPQHKSTGTENGANHSRSNASNVYSTEQQTTYATFLRNTTNDNATLYNDTHHDATDDDNNDVFEKANHATISATTEVILTSTSTNNNQSSSSSRHHHSEKEATVVKRKPPSSLLSPQPFFSSWTYDGMKSKRTTKSSSAKSKAPSSTTSASAAGFDKQQMNATRTTSSTSTSASARLLSNKNPNDVLTVGELQEILQAGGYVRQDELDSRSGAAKTTRGKAATTTSPEQRAKQVSISSSSSKTTTRGSGSLAFPQQSVLSYNDLTAGSTVAASLLGMLLAITIRPNLWLVGSVVGSMYGFDTAKRYSNHEPATNILSKTVISIGRRLAKAYLSVYDFMYGIWFMYKTGQLSYDYYKQYAKLDERFGIQEKMDAWNARFVQGKKNFDAWEKENEIGRRVLASFRTAWLVEEKRRKQTQYRIVQSFHDVVNWCKRFVKAIWSAMIGDSDSSLSQVLKGIRINVSEARAQEIGPRIGAAVMALVSVVMIGSLYAIAPRFLGLVAIAIGVIFPTWVSELWDRLQLLMEEFAATGRGEDVTYSDASGGIPTTLSQQFGLYDKKRYSFYRRQDGSRRWYRVGRPAFRSDDDSTVQKKRKKRIKKKGGRNNTSPTTGDTKRYWTWFS